MPPSVEVCQYTVQPAKSNHLEEILQVVALCKWLVFAGSVMITVMSNLHIMVDL